MTLLGASILFAQEDSSSAASAATGPDANGGAMLIPAPISGEGYAMGFTSETRSNYLRGGLTFGSAYDSDATTGTNGKPIGEMSYSIWPTIALDQTRSRLHWVLTYSPGFTFYQKTSGLNQADQNLMVDFKFRLSPHVTLALRDSFIQTSNVLSQPYSDLEQPVSGGISVPNNSVVAPLAETLTNSANATLSYQFAANAMLGASGTFYNLHYPTQSQVPGLYDSSSKGGSAFYNYRVSKMHYIGATYQYQDFLSFPTAGQSETQTHSIFLFYTVYLKPTFSISLYGGPQYSNTVQFGTPSTTAWAPAGGGSISWQGKLTSLAASYSYAINGGGGLAGAVHSNSGSVSLRRQVTRTLSAALGASYASNKLLDALPEFSDNGHTISGNASVQRQIGEHFNVQLQYTRLHQSYNDIAAISSVPDRNVGAVRISYQFSRPLGR